MAVDREVSLVRAIAQGVIDIVQNVPPASVNAALGTFGSLVEAGFNAPLVVDEDFDGTDSESVH